MSKSVTVWQAKRKLGLMARTASRSAGVYFIVDKGESKAVLLGSRAYYGLCAAAELLGKTDLQSDIRQGFSQLSSGTSLSAEQFPQASNETVEDHDGKTGSRQRPCASPRADSNKRSRKVA